MSGGGFESRHGRTQRDAGGRGGAVRRSTFAAFGSDWGEPSSSPEEADSSGTGGTRGRWCRGACERKPRSGGRPRPHGFGWERGGVRRTSRTGSGPRPGRCGSGRERNVGIRASLRSFDRSDGTGERIHGRQNEAVAESAEGTGRKHPGGQSFLRRDAGARTCRSGTRTVPEPLVPQGVGGRRRSCGRVRSAASGSACAAGCDA